MIVAAIDRALARFFLVTPDGLEELAGAFTVSSRGGKYHSDREDAPGEGERKYHARQAEERHHHYRAAVERLEELAGRHPGSGLVLAGPPAHTSALSALLPEALAGRVLGTCRLNPRAVTAAGLRAAVEPVVEAHERERTEAELGALQESIGAGRAVEGTRDTLAALARHRVHTLYVAEEPMISDAVANDALEDAFRDGARVVIVPRDLVPLPANGLAAVLRFR